MNEKPSGWAIGWMAFAACMMSLMGLWWILVGLAGVAANEFFVAAPNWIFKLDATTWGWIHFGVGVLVLFASYGLFAGAVWARTVGVIIAIVAAIAAFAWLPWYPVWAVLFIAVSVAVVWALTAHGRDILAE